MPETLTWPPPNNWVRTPDPSLTFPDYVPPLGGGEASQEFYWIYFKKNDPARRITGVFPLKIQDLSYPLSPSLEIGEEARFFRGSYAIPHATVFHWRNVLRIPVYADIDGNVFTDPTTQHSYLFHHPWKWMIHCCQAAHHIISNHNPDDLHLLDPDNWNTSPSGVAHSADSVERDRIALWYWRTLLGYTYERLRSFERKPTDSRGIAAGLRWQDELNELSALDALICDGCGGHHLQTRDFKKSMDLTAWKAQQMHHTLQNKRPVARLPKIDKTVPQRWRPSSESVFGIGLNDASAASGNYWRSYAEQFGKAVDRWDNDPLVRAE